MQASARLSSSSSAAAAFRKVMPGVSTAATRSCYCYRTSRGKAHAAAPLPAQEPPQKGKRKIAMQERRAKIMEFVDNYRASNDGKFPTMTYTRQQVGGNNYTVSNVLQEMKYKHAKLALDNSKADRLQETVKVIEQPRPKDEARVTEIQGMLELSDHSVPKDHAEVTQLQATDQVSDHSFSKDEGKVAWCQGAFQSHDLSCVKAAKHDMDTAADAPVLSDQTESERMKEDNPDLGNQQREIEANNFDLKNSEKTLNANDSNGSDQSERDMVNEAKTCDREDNPKLEESANTGLLGSLKQSDMGTVRNPVSQSLRNPQTHFGLLSG